MTDDLRTVGGRSYVLSRTDGAPSDTLLVVAGGGGWSVERTRAETGLDAYRLPVAWLSTSPTKLGLPRLSWNAGAGCCGEAARLGIDDVGYAAEVIGDAVSATGASRVLAIGASNGGILAYTLGAVPGLVHGVGVVAGCRLHELAPVVQVVHVHGDADAMVPWGGGPVREGGGYACRAILAECIEAAGGRWDAAEEPRGAAVWTYRGGDVTLHRARQGGHTWFRTRSADATDLLLRGLGVVGGERVRAA